MPILYRFAQGNSGDLVDVEDLLPQTRHSDAPYTCCGCGGAVLPRFGRTKAITPHFYHEASSDSESCSQESYLHRAAKLAFFQMYTRALAAGKPVELTYPTTKTCNYFKETLGLECVDEVQGRHDLTAHFEKIQVETAHGEFVPDILLSSARHEHVVYVEFAVTHHCEPEKRKSGTRIIEWTLHSDWAIVEIAKGVIQHGSDVELMNFNLRRAEGPTCAGACPKQVLVFILYESGKSIILEMAPKKFEEGAPSGKVRYKLLLGWDDEDADRGDLYRYAVRRAHFERVKIRNCYVCRYHGRGTVDEPIFCKYLKEGSASSKAIECKYYRPFRNWKECEVADEKNGTYVLKQNLMAFFSGLVPY